MKFKYRMISAVTAAALSASCLAWSAFADKAEVFEAEEGALLGAATHFHIFADTVTLNSHVHGNVATNFLSTDQRDFGVRLDKLDGLPSINYIKDFWGPNLNEQTLSTLLVVGSQTKVDYTVDNGNKVGITSAAGGTATFSYKTIGELVVEDADTPYIDINAELEKLSDMSEKIAAQKNSSGISLKKEGNVLTIDCSDAEDTFLYYTLDLDNGYSYLNGTGEIDVKGIDYEHGQFLYITVDVGDRDSVNFEKGWDFFDKNGEAISFGEISLAATDGRRLVYNIVSDGKAYTGEATLSEYKLGSFLCPEGTIINKGNTNGTIVAKTAIINGESHRWDVQIEGTYSEKDVNPDLEDKKEDTGTGTNTGTPSNTDSDDDKTPDTPSNTTPTGSSVVGGDDTPSNTTPTGSSVVTSSDTGSTTTPATLAPVEDETTTTPATTVTTAPTSDDVPAPITTTTAAAGNDGVAVTTTTSAVAGNAEDSAATTTTTTEDNDTAGVGIDDIRIEFDEIPVDPQSDDDITRMEQLIEDIDRLIEGGLLTDEEIDELMEMRRVLGARVDAYSNPTPATDGATAEGGVAGTGFALTGISIGVLACSLLVIAASIVGRKKLEDEED